MFKEVEGDFADGGEVLRGVSGPFPAVVFAESDIEQPVRLAFNAPVLPDDRVDPRRIRAQAGDLELIRK